MVASISIIRVEDGVLTSADSASISVYNAADVEIISDVAVTPSSAGNYSYDVTSLAAGNYLAVWTFVNTGFADEVISRSFTVDNPTMVIRGITLAELERRVARRVGPFHPLRAYVGSVDDVTVKSLRSSLEIGDYEDMFLLRRGFMSSGLYINNFNSDDRQRIVASYIASTGTLTPDYVWAVSPIENEAMELHSLDPENELRYAVRQGLERCYFWDTLDIQTTSNVRDISLSDIAPWITRPEQVSGVQYGRVGSFFLPQKAPWYKTYRSGRDIRLQATLPYSGYTRITVLRPHSSFVNGETVLAGPESDNDVLHVDPEYATLAGHLQCWINFTSKLRNAANEGMTIDHADVARAFSIRTASICPPAPDIVQNLFENGTDILEDAQIGNI